MSTSLILQMIVVPCSLIQTSFAIVFQIYFPIFFKLLSAESSIYSIIGMIYLLFLSIDGVFGLVAILFYDLFQNPKIHFMLPLIKAILSIGLYGFRFVSLFFGILVLIFSQSCTSNFNLNYVSKILGVSLLFVAILGSIMEISLLIYFPFTQKSKESVEIKQIELEN